MKECQECKMEPSIWPNISVQAMVSTAAFHARVRGSFPGLGGLKETNMFLPHPLVKLSIVGSLRDREVACSTSDRQGSNFESCVWRAVSSHSSHHPHEVLLAQFICAQKWPKAQFISFLSDGRRSIFAAQHTTKS